MSAIEIEPKVSPEPAPVGSSAVLSGESDTCECAEQSAVLGSPAVPTPTALANHDFYLSAQKIEGVQVRVSGGNSWSEKTIVVTVPDLLAAKADEVFDLELRIYDKYPSAQLHVHVSESASGA